MRSPVELSVEPEFRRGHGSVYDALAGGRIDAGRLRRLQVAAMAPAAAGDPLMFGIDVTPLARPDAVFADEMVMVQVRGAGGDRYLPGWPLSVLVGVQWGSSSWVDAIEARRLRPGEDHAGATVAQITDLLGDLAATGKWRPGDPPPLVMLDAGYPATDISWALAGAAGAGAGTAAQRPGVLRRSRAARARAAGRAAAARAAFRAGGRKNPSRPRRRAGRRLRTVRQSTGPGLARPAPGPGIAPAGGPALARWNGGARAPRTRRRWARPARRLTCIGPLPQLVRFVVV